MYFEVRETQSDRLPSRTGYQSDWMTGPTGTQSPSRGLELVHPYFRKCFDIWYVEIKNNSDWKMSR